MFGQIRPSKGHKEVLEAILKTKTSCPSSTVSLHILGPGENVHYVKELQDFVLNNDMAEQVKIETGFFEKEEVMPFYEVLIVASGSEAFGRVIPEANKAGLKVIVKNSGGAPELVNAANGFLYEDVYDLASIMDKNIELPEAGIKPGYDEVSEVQKLKKWLSELA
jgi:glycosyltransferase involved in cell wall biosynthesis